MPVTTEYEISTDGITVWVNGAWCLGRFGRFGIDIHRAITKRTPNGGCLYCTHAHTGTTAADWDIFVIKMKELHGIDVPEKYKPKRFKEKAA